MAVWSEVLFGGLPGDRRIDPEYYQPEYLRLDDVLNKRHAPPWGTLRGRFIVGPFGSEFLVENYAENSLYRYVRGRDVKRFFLLDDHNCYISKLDFERLSKYHLQAGDLLISVVGTLGNIAIVTEDVGPAVFSCKSTAFRSPDVDPYFLCAYLNSSIGQAYLRRLPRGHVQTGLNLPDLKGIPIFQPEPAIETAIARIVRRSYEDLLIANQCYGEAQALLESALGLDKLDLAPRLSYERPHADVKTAGRCDAEYFTPRMQNLLTALSLDGLTIADVAKLTKRRFKAKAGVEFQYIEIADVTGSGTADSNPVAGEEAPSRATWIVESGDIITSTVRPIRRLSAIITNDQDSYVCSSGFAVLTPQHIAPELLLVYLRLPLVCELLDLHTTASMYPAISTPDLMQIPIALPNHTTTQRILAKVRESFAARREAQRQRNDATAMVEHAILGA